MDKSLNINAIKFAHVINAASKKKPPNGGCWRRQYKPNY